MAPRAGLPIWIAVIAALLLNTDVILGDLSTSPFDEVFSRVLDRFCGKSLQLAKYVGSASDLQSAVNSI